MRPVATRVKAKSALAARSAGTWEMLPGFIGPRMSWDVTLDLRMRLPALWIWEPCLCVYFWTSNIALHESMLEDYRSHVCVVDCPTEDLCRLRYARAIDFGLSRYLEGTRVNHSTIT
ncbi:hypothetical protein VTL71DRAFT_9271 [Oculimacula yallundae]|uniref:Uncharacterized protein n=1 Tax=Oculimacula yallundae TaxID=86028 RepID=A0ABR4BSQ6_9HELO